MVDFASEYVLAFRSDSDEEGRFKLDFRGDSLILVLLDFEALDVVVLAVIMAQHFYVKFYSL